MLPPDPPPPPEPPGVIVTVVALSTLSNPPSGERASTANAYSTPSSKSSSTRISGSIVSAICTHASSAVTGSFESSPVVSRVSFTNTR